MEQVEPTKTGRPGLRRRKQLLLVLWVALICHIVFQWVLWPVKVLGDSMSPNYRDGARHFVNRLAYWSKKPQRGDVVTVRVREGEIYIKRIVGLPGETVEFRDGRIYINGERLAEEYTESLIPWDELKEYSIPLADDLYFVAGDNRATTVLVAVPGDRIIGKVVF